MSLPHHRPMMRLLGTCLSLRLLLLPLLSAVVSSADIHKPLDCRDFLGGSDHDSDRDHDHDHDHDHAEACARPVDDIVAIVPGSSYIASLACDDCPYVKPTWTIDHEPLSSDQILMLNLTLSSDNRTLLLNGMPFYPLPTIPTPPEFWVTQRPASFSNTNLTSGLTCANPSCSGSNLHPDCEPWCTALRLSSVQIDYLYTVKPSAYDGADQDPATQYHEVTLDVLGGKAGTWFPHWKFDSTSQQTLWLLVQAKESKRASPAASKQVSGPGDLFGPHGGQEDVAYDLEIIDLRLEPRSYKLPEQKPLGFWRSIGRFFGADVWEDEGRRFLYLDEAWGDYGKKGTLRNSFGHFVHWPQWILLSYIIPSTIAAIAVLLGAYKLFFWIQRQKQLMAWDGIEDVWDRLRNEPAADEAHALLPAAYQDDPDAGGSSTPQRYTDEPLTMKSLPSKPLPEKPLPSVPLIDT